MHRDLFQRLIIMMVTRLHVGLRRGEHFAFSRSLPCRCDRAVNVHTAEWLKVYFVCVLSVACKEEEQGRGRKPAGSLTHKDRPTDTLCIRNSPTPTHQFAA